MATVSGQYSIILRVEIDHRPGMLGRVATAVGERFSLLFSQTKTGASVDPVSDGILRRT